ncbi:hypothetical protein A9Q99_07415 [Gammaproteobacteria bacterium 45_16_T64]|nr:hypothetical protein A9Q99_07415 [Gammaproteobacteria bacterium 45_16_T64]
MNIQNKLLLAFWFVALLSGGLLATTALYNATDAISYEIENALNTIADENVKHIQKYVLQKEHDAATYGSLPIVARAMEDLDRYYKEGIETLNYQTRAIKYRPTLQQLKNRLNSYNLFLINTEGDIVFSIIRERDFATNLLTGPYKSTQLAKTFIGSSTLLETKVSTFSPYLPSQWRMHEELPGLGQERHSAFVAAPIFVGNTLLGVLAFQLHSNDYYHLSGNYAGIKRSGEIVISKRVNNNAIVIAPLRRNPDAAFNVKIPLDGMVAKPIQWSVTGNKGSGLSISYEGTEVFAAWRYIPELEWGIVIKVEAAEAFASANSLKRQFLIVGVTCFLITGLLGAYFARRLTAPILLLLDATKRITQGDLEQEITVDSSDEVGQLAVEFNEMLISRKKYEGDLKKTNKEAQDALRELAEQKYALDQHAIVSITDLEGIITFANDRYSDISGYSREELVGQNQRLLDSRCHAYDEIEQIYNTISHNNVWNGEISNKNKSGEIYWTDTTITPFIGDDGLPKSYIYIRSEITTRKHAEIALIDSKNAAEAATQAKSDFLASMSHEIRTPMNGVLGMLGLLFKTDLTKDQQRKAGLAQSSAQSLLSLINDILDFSKVDAGKMELEILDFDLRTMLDEFTDSMAFKAQEKGLEVILDVIGIEQSMVRGDPSRLRQILTNLVGNSIKFTSSGEIVISARLLPDGDQLSLQCTIKDTGIGIPDDKQAMLFDAFTQVDASTTRHYGGTGLGLSIVKKLCHLMGGSIQVSSFEGEGSTFSFNITLEQSTRSIHVIPKIDMSTLTLLVVDDNSTNRAVLGEQLEHWGAKVQLAENGDQALALMQKRKSENKSPFDVAFLDYQMPEMDGSQLAENIKKDSHLGKTRLVMMTSLTHRGDAKYFADLGFDAYFPKPATTSDIFNALSVIVDDSEALSNAQPLVTHHYLASLQNDANKSLEKLEEADTSTPRWPANTRLLLVEDNQINQEVAKGVLEVIGLETDVAADGNEAIQSLQLAPDNMPYTLILMDCQMPQMDGYEATHNIRIGKAGERYLSIPIVAMTANAMKGDKEKCLTAGMDDYVSKPIEPDELEIILQRWLSAGSSQLTARIRPKIANKLSEEEKTAIWDRRGFCSRLQGLEELQQSLLDLFLEEMPDRLIELKQFIEQDNMAKTAHISHIIKGIAANVSGSLLHGYATNMEVSSLAGDKKTVKSLQQDIDQAYRALAEQISHYTQQKTG